MSKRTVLSTTAFKSSAEERFSNPELERLVDRIEADPCDGEEAEGLEGLRILPWPSRSSGELVWHQVAYLYLEQYEFVYLLDMLDCQEQALPTNQDKLDAIEKVGAGGADRRNSHPHLRIMRLLPTGAYKMANRREREDECCAAQRAEQAGSRQACEGAG